MRTLEYTYDGPVTLRAEFTHTCGKSVLLTGHDDDSWFKLVNKYPRIVECKGCFQSVVVKWNLDEVLVWE